MTEQSSLIPKNSSQEGLGSRSPESNILHKKLVLDPSNTRRDDDGNNVAINENRSMYGTNGLEEFRALQAKHEQMRGKEVYIDTDIYYTRTAQTISVMRENPGPILPLEEEQKWLAEKGYTEQVEWVQYHSGITNSEGFTFVEGKGTISDKGALDIARENFEKVKTVNAQEDPSRYVLVKFVPWRPPSSPLRANVLKISDEGKILKVQGELQLGGSYFKYNPSMIEKEGGPWHILRKRDDAFLKSWAELSVDGKPYVTTKGRYAKVTHATEEFPVLSPTRDKEKLGERAQGMERVGDPDRSCNCHGDGILDGKGKMDGSEALKVIEDDFVFIEYPTVRDRLVFWRPQTNVPTHMVRIKEMSRENVFKVTSKERAEGGWFDCHPQALEGAYGDYQPYYKKTTLGEDFQREEGQYGKYQQFLEETIVKLKSYKKNDNEAVAKRLSAILQVIEHFYKKAASSLTDANRTLPTTEEAEKDIESFRLRRMELSYSVKQIQGNIPSKQKEYATLATNNILADAQMVSLTSVVMGINAQIGENGMKIQMDSQQLASREKEHLLARGKAVNAVTIGKGQEQAIVALKQDLQVQEQTKNDLFSAVQNWAQSLETKVKESSWNPNLKHIMAFALGKLREHSTAKNVKKLENIYKRMDKDIEKLSEFLSSDASSTLAT